MVVLDEVKILELGYKDWIGDHGPFSTSLHFTKKALFSSGLREDAMAAPRITESSLQKDFEIEPFNPNNLNDDGLDFTIGTKIYASDRLLSEKVSLADLDELVKEGGARKINLREGEKFDFSTGVIYYVLSKEKVKMPTYLELVVDSKSTLGRLGCLCHDASGSDFFDEKSHLIGVVRPYVFPIRVTAGKSKLLQAVLRFKNSSHMTREEMLKNGDEIKIKVSGKDVSLADYLIEDKIALHFSTHKAYVARPSAVIPGPVDVGEKEQLDYKDYFEEVCGDGKILLEPGKFYLLGTKENLSFGGVCGRLSRDYGGHLTGLWSQFAGIIHAGFNGEITLECKTDEKRLIRDGDLAGTIELDKLSKVYKDQDGIFRGKGSYLGQKAPRLPKVFKQD